MLVLCMACAGLVAAEPVDPAEPVEPAARMERADITPGHVLARVNLLARLVEDVRWLMGRPRNELRTLHVQDARPREVYYQAQSLFLKANRLAAGTVGRAIELPPAPAATQLQPADVYRVVVAAQSQIQVLRAALGGRETYEADAADPAATPSDVYHRVLSVARQINALSDQPPNAAESLQTVNQAISELQQLLANAKAPPFSAQDEKPGMGHIPGDVFHRLLQSMRILSQAMQLADIPVLRVTPLNTSWIEDSDVIDVANMLISELAYLNSRFPGRSAAGADEEPGPGFVVPSLVLRQVGTLEQMLLHLLRHVERQPDSLQGGD